MQGYISKYKFKFLQSQKKKKKKKKKKKRRRKEEKKKRRKKGDKWQPTNKFPFHILESSINAIHITYTPPPFDKIKDD
jgi:hypothetical protein